MQRYILIRVVEGFITLLLISVVVFALVRLTGSPIDLFLPPGASEEQVQELKTVFGLDKSVPVQYLSWLKQVVQGDFGVSFRSRLPVSELLLLALPNSFKLAAVGMSMALVSGLLMGVWAAVARGKAVDQLVGVIAILGQSIPGFWLGLMMIQLFSVQLGILPVAGMGSWKHYIMPAMTLAFWALAAIARLLRSSMLEVLDSDYVLLARIKGVSERRVIWSHALRNALIPVVTFSGVYFSLMITAGVVNEYVFSWPGVGFMVFDAIQTRDFPIVQGIVLMSAAIIVVVNLIVDILYGYLDPRISIGVAGGE